MSWKPEQPDQQAIVRYEGRPHEIHRPREKTRWRRFLEFLRLTSRTAHGLGEAYAEAEVVKKRNEAVKVAAEAAEIAARADLTRSKVVTVLSDQIERIVTNEDMPEEAIEVQLSLLAKAHPEILEQGERFEKLVETLRLKRGTRLEIVQDEPAALEPPAGETGP